MTTTQITIHNVETGVVVERVMTADELAQLAIDQAKAQKLAATQAANLAAKESAEAKLAALGLTADDLKALGL